MASIQILELRPVDGQIEDLSYDKTGLIMGGGTMLGLTYLIVPQRSWKKSGHNSRVTVLLPENCTLS